MESIDLTGLIMDGVLVLLLGAVLYACIRVNSRLSVIRAGQTELADLVDRLELATSKAREAIGELRQESRDVGDTLGATVRKARALSDELTLITEAGDNLANRLEQGLTTKAAAPGGKVTSLPGVRPDLLNALKEAR